MPEAELSYGHNEPLRGLAQEIIVTQQQEIAVMRLALGEPLPPSVPSAIFEQHAHAVVSLDAYVVCLCHRRPHMKRRFFTV